MCALNSEINYLLLSTGSGHCTFQKYTEALRNFAHAIYRDFFQL